jgi:TPP-dependent pyruvate/acetoin dehydrogenase alpha subunit
VGEGWIDQDKATAIEREAAADVETAVRLARDSPFPDPDLASKLVYAASDDHGGPG